LGVRHAQPIELWALVKCHARLLAEGPQGHKGRVYVCARWNYTAGFARVGEHKVPGIRVIRGVCMCVCAQSRYLQGFVWGGGAQGFVRIGLKRDQ